MFSILCIELSTYGQNRLIVLMNKTKKMYKTEKIRFGQAEKIRVQLDDEYYTNGENAKIRKFMIIFAKMWMEK